MKTKIIYISGNEIFDMRDIRAAFDEVRCALNLDKDTLLFGVPVDSDDAGIMNRTPTENVENTKEIVETIPEPIPNIKESVIPESVVETEIVTPKKRGRPRKEENIESVEQNEPINENIDEYQNESIVAEQNDNVIVDETDEMIPVLSILSGNNDNKNESVVVDDNTNNIEIIDEINDEQIENNEIIEDVKQDVDIVEEEESEPDLEKLLSEMTPLAEDTHDDTTNEPIIEESYDDVSVDATLEQLANEFAENQDKIASESKTSSRGKIGKLRNILPFKQSKHKDQGIGDLLEWAGIAANDEDFSVPGFFTNVASKK